MDRRSLLAAVSILSLCIVAPLGCAVETAEEEGEGVAETQEELSFAAKSLVGKYYTPSPAFGGLARLTLAADGTYWAELDAAGRALCVTSPCLIPESGTFNAVKSGGKIRLRIRPTGGPSRWYDAVKGASELTLTRAGTSETLFALEANGCLDDKDCSEGEQCGPKLCLMWCAVDDPFCCGPSTCEPKPGPKVCGGIANIPCGPNETCVDDPNDGCDPSKGGADCSGICVPDMPPYPPPPSCWGAWLDQNGLCRTPADGVYPPECCAGPKCGDARCAQGQVCCNPLAGICTAPGEVCAQ